MEKILEMREEKINVKAKKQMQSLLYIKSPLLSMPIKINL